MTNPISSPRVGRPKAAYKSSDGKYYPGLRHRSDGRWDAKVNGKTVTFTQPDERRAISHFIEMTDRLAAAGQRLEENNWTEQKHISLEQLWRYVTEQIRTRPIWVAKQTGIEQIGYLDSISPPEPIPTPMELGELFVQFGKCKIEQRRKVQKYWLNFVDETGISSAREITDKLAVKYMDAVHERGLGAKEQQHIFGGVRRIISFAISRAIAVKDLSAIQMYLRLMKADGVSKKSNPDPISVTDFRAMLAVSDGQNKAMLLLMLNCCLYAGEVYRVKWDELKNGVFVSRREKEGKNVRCAKLWKETVAALDNVPIKCEYVFSTFLGKPLQHFGVFDRFEAMREKANCLHVKPSHLRDGAYSASVAANVSFPLCQLLAGHSCGMADAYVLADPAMVAPASEAVYRKYFGKAKK